MTVRPVRLVAGPDVTVFEAWLDSPPEQPLHCPPALTQLHFRDGRLTRRMVSHYAARDPVSAAG